MLCSTLRLLMPMYCNVWRCGKSPVSRCELWIVHTVLHMPSIRTLQKWMTDLKCQQGLVTHPPRKDQSEIWREHLQEASKSATQCLNQGGRFVTSILYTSKSNLSMLFPNNQREAPLVSKLCLYVSRYVSYDFSDPYGYPHIRIKHLHKISRVWPTRMEMAKTPEFVAMSWPEVRALESWCLKRRFFKSLRLFQ